MRDEGSLRECSLPHGDGYSPMLHALSFRLLLRKIHLLVATRSRSGENNAPCCFLIPSRRYATSEREAYCAVRLRIAIIIAWTAG